VSLETGENLGNMQRGEVCVRGPNVMKGYYGNERITAQAIDQKGWFHTEDIGYYDKDGDFFIVDWVKEIIKYKGYQVSWLVACFYLSISGIILRCEYKV